jgi:hypothetical protein
MNYACPIWSFAAHTRVGRLQVSHSKCVHLVTGAPQLTGNSQIHEELGVPFFTHHIGAQTEIFDAKLADVETLYFGR